MVRLNIYVQSQFNAQNYNRFSYCFNSPMMFTDPTGWKTETHLRDSYMIPEKGSSNNNLYIDLPGPSINENNYLYNFYGHDKTDNSKLESDQSSEVDVNNGTKKEEDKPKTEEDKTKSDGDDNDSHEVSITNREEQKLFATPLISADLFSSSTIEGKNPNIELTKVKNELSSVTKYYGGMSFSLGVDGSFSAGLGIFSYGINAHGDFTTEISIPNGNINNGLSITINRSVGVGLVGVGAAVLTYGLLPPGSHQLLRLGLSY